MFGPVSRIASRLLTRRPTTTRTRAADPLRCRLCGDELEGRDCPSVWLDTTGDHQFGNPLNWDTGQVPQSGDTVIFEESDKDCQGMAGSFAEIALGGYAGTVTFTGPVTTLVMYMDAGAIYQEPGADLTIYQSLGWYGGTINTSTNLANITVDGSMGGATADIDPGGGTVTTGDTIRLVGGAIATFYDGTVNFTGGDGIAVDSGNVNFEIGAAGVNVQYTGPIPSQGKITLPAGATGTFYRKAGLEGFAVSGTSELPIVVTGGTFTLGYGVLLTVTGRVGGNDGANVSQQAGITRLYHNENLDAGLIVPNGMVVSGGTMTTVNNGSGNDQITTIIGNLLVSGGNVTIDEGRQVGHHFGALNVAGDITWIDGVFRPFVDGTVGSILCDQWGCNGTFTIFAAGAVWDNNGFAANVGAKLGPAGALNNQANLAGRTWDILYAGLLGGFQLQQGSPALSFETQAEANVWGMLPMPNGGTWTLRRNQN